MPDTITFHVEHNLNDPDLPPWTIRLYPIDPLNASRPAPWSAAITAQGVTIQANGLTDHTTWRALTRAEPQQGA